MLNLEDNVGDWGLAYTTKVTLMQIGFKEYFYSSQCSFKQAVRDIQGGLATARFHAHLATTKNYRDSLGVGGVLIDLLW